MNKQEAHNLIEWLRNAQHDFFVKPEAASGLWADTLKRYTPIDAIDACQSIISSGGDVHTPHTIKAHCDRIRHEREQHERSIEDNRKYASASESFANVPGETRAQKILYVCAERASKRISDDYDNEFFGALLNKAKQAGITFDNVDYERIKNHTNDWCDGFVSFSRRTR